MLFVSLLPFMLANKEYQTVYLLQLTHHVLPVICTNVFKTVVTTTILLRFDRFFESHSIEIRPRYDLRYDIGPHVVGCCCSVA